MWRYFQLLAGTACLLLGAVAHAERATERYAPAQISVARDFLERARAATSLEEYSTARLYAQQAELDARLAWAMTDAAPLRAEAERIAAAAAAFTRALTTSSPARPAGSYPSPSVQAQAGAPSPR